MARKTNKTNHVLNLLAGNGEEAEETKKSPGAEPEITNEPQKPAGPVVEVVATGGDGDEIANTVNQLLEEELLAETGGEEKEPAKEPETEKAVPEPEEPAPEPKETVPEPEEPVKEPEETAPAKEEPAPKSEETVLKAEESAPHPDEELVKAAYAEGYMPEFGEEETAIMKEAEEKGEKAYEFVNVMEYLVEDKVQMYIKKFGCCTCSRCTADTKALALTHLKPKYVVVHRDAVAPLMNFYSQQFAGDVTVEITKACIRVKERPHHNRD